MGERFGVTVNDVALAAVAGSFRDALMRRGLTPRRDSLRTLVPVSVRPASRLGEGDNLVSLMLPFLPVDLSDPVERLHAVHTRLTAAKSGGQRQAGNTLVWLSSRLVPFAVTAAAVRLLSRLPQRGVVTVATNVPGPRRRLTVMGRDVDRLLPIPPIAVQLRTGVAMLSYADTLAFGLLADYDAAADADELTAGIRREVARLRAADGPRRGNLAPVAGRLQQQPPFGRRDIAPGLRRHVGGHRDRGDAHAHQPLGEVRPARRRLTAQ